MEEFKCLVTGVCGGISSVMTTEIMENELVQPPQNYGSQLFYENWFQEYVNRGMENFSVEAGQDLCKNLLKTGHWEEFETHGFERKRGRSRSKKTAVIAHPYHFDYPYKPWPFFKSWSEQNYSGIWKSNDDCEMKILNESELSECFNHGKKRILLIGDSRTRQLANALTRRIKQEHRFKDRQFFHYKKYFNQQNLTKVEFIWSQHVGRSVRSYVNAVSR